MGVYPTAAATKGKLLLLSMLLTDWFACSGVKTNCILLLVVQSVTVLLQKASVRGTPSPSSGRSSSAALGPRSLFRASPHANNIFGQQTVVGRAPGTPRASGV